MVSLEKAVIARLQKGGDRFEILVDPHEAEHILDGKIENILSALAIDAVFSDSKKGTHAPIESLQKQFRTTDISTIAKEIIQKGEIQLTTEQRHEMQQQKKKRIVDLIVKNAMDPKTKMPHPRTRIEIAIDEAKVHIDPFKSVNQQMKTIIEVLRPIIPISIEHLLAAAQYYISEKHDVSCDWRIDFISIERYDRHQPPAITHFENALTP